MASKTMISFLIVLLGIVMSSSINLDNVKLSRADPINTAITYYLEDIAMAPTNSANFLYYKVTLCPNSMAGYNQAELFISLPDNVKWEINDGFVYLQVSECANNFTQPCIIGTNYDWAAIPTLTKTLIWNIHNTSAEYYIRVLGGYIPTRFQLDLTVVKDKVPTSFPWETNLPFTGDIIGPNIQPIPLSQYWKAMERFTVKNNEFILFALAYCDQDPHTVGGITVAAIGSPEKPYSEITQWACPQTSSVCTPNVAMEDGWLNTNVASFNLLDCNDVGHRTTQYGIYVAVLGDGGEEDEINEFYIQATLITNYPAKNNATIKKF